MKPQNDKLVIEPVKDETEIGNFSFSEQGKATKGIIIAVNPTSLYKVGDKVIYDKNSTFPITIDDKEVLFIAERNIWAVL